MGSFPVNHNGNLLEIGLKNPRGFLGSFSPPFSGNSPSVHALPAVNNLLSTVVAHKCHMVWYYTIWTAMLTILVWIFAFAITITIHEAAHAWTADRLGDPTARLAGRLSLNPINHYDPIGTTLLLVLVILRAFGIPVIPFGWAKPVPIDPYNLPNPKRDSALISLAGPLTNLVFAGVLSILLRINSGTFMFNLLFPVILLNVALAIFNLIPIHPLDGGKVLVGLLPTKDARELDIFLQRYGLFILFILIFPLFNGNSLITSVLDPVINFILNLLVPGFGTI